MVADGEISEPERSENVCVDGGGFVQRRNDIVCRT